MHAEDEDVAITTDIEEEEKDNYDVEKLLCEPRSQEDIVEDAKDEDENSTTEMEDEENRHDVEKLLGEPSSQEDLADDLHAEDEDENSTTEMQDEENSYDFETLLGEPSTQEDIADNLPAEDEDAACTAEMEDEEKSYDVEKLLGEPSSQVHPEEDDAGSTTEMEDEENSYDVEKLLRERRQKDGIYYLVRWLGYSSRYDSWVHEIDVGQDLVDELHASVKNNLQKTRSCQENDRMEECKQPCAVGQSLFPCLHIISNDNDSISLLSQPPNLPPQMTKIPIVRQKWTKKTIAVSPVAKSLRAIRMVRTKM